MADWLVARWRLLAQIARMPAPSRRLHAFTESVIRAMTRLSNQHGAINLSQGFPDFNPPEELLAALERATKAKRFSTTEDSIVASDRTSNAKP